MIQFEASWQLEPRSGFLDLGVDGDSCQLSVGLLQADGGFFFSENGDLMLVECWFSGGVSWGI